MTQTTLREYLRTTEDAISSGRIDEAMTNCQNILAYFPEALEAQHLLGEVYLAQGQLEEAQQTFEWILTNDPENVIAYCDRALISERTSDIDTALDCYQQAYELSRGNANIRQEFNQLSARAGQPEFMFSRAGLARLYMRGNLLTQAIQEWESVLAVSPDRLDARLGLIETYWREGSFDKAEPLASRLLEEIPTCLKALLYLAHMVSISSIARARDLVLRAETLDPELRIAQEMFGELLANQPHDPFLHLIQKEPIVLEDGVPLNQPLPPAPAPRVEPPALDQATIIPPASPLPPTSSGADWELDAREPSDANGENSPFPRTIDQAEPQAPSWQEHLIDEEQPAQPWYEQEQYAAMNAVTPTPHWEDQPSIAAESPTLSSEIQEEEQPAQPAWLHTLTHTDQPQVEPGVSQLSVAPAPPAEQQPTLAATTQASQESEGTPFFFPEDEGENEMGWPEWLKSLGAETLEPETPSGSLGDAGGADAGPWPVPATSGAGRPDWMQQLAGSAYESGQTATPEWMQQPTTPMQETAQPAASAWTNQFSEAQNQPYQQPTTPATGSIAEQQEQHYVTSLEDLEKSLQGQGFTPLAPGSLASIAQAQQVQTNAPMQQPRTREEEAALPSALAQLGSFTQPSHTPVSASPTSGEPWWNAILTQSSEQSPATTAPTLDPFAALGARSDLDATAPMPVLPATPAPLQSTLNQSPVTAPPLTPTYRSDALLDSDLETTMKRPAVKLQPMANERLYANGKGPGGERATGVSIDEGTLSPRERLLRGYQYQLAGAYDEAMNEYRLIIRNAPELLDEVISNMRALLKLNPRFSLGYRVLGDAYMRKGEYLQAMESYNKALTMAKKARS